LEVVTEPTPRDEMLTAGRDEATPFRVLFRVALAIFVVFLIVGGAAFGVWEAFK
jgi:hypothetical protein